MSSEEAQPENKPKTRKRTSTLSEDQRKKHHIESEHKRRQAIRDAFAKLVDLVPELEPSDSRSEILVLTKSAEYLTLLYKENETLRDQLTSKGIAVNNKLKVELPTTAQE